MSESNMDITTPLLQELTCNICFNFLTVLPVLETPNGYFICGKCSKDESIGDLVFTTSVSKIFEKISKYLSFPCVYKNHGCNHKITPSVTNNHEEICEYAIICPIDDCGIKFSNINIQNHLINYHKSKIISTTFKPQPEGIGRCSKRIIMKNQEVFVLYEIYMKPIYYFTIASLNVTTKSCFSIILSLGNTCLEEEGLPLLTYTSSIPDIRQMHLINLEERGLLSNTDKIENITCQINHNTGDANIVKKCGKAERIRLGVQLIESAKKGDIDEVKILLEQQADVTVVDNDGQNALIWACKNESTLCVAKLLEYKCDCNAKDSDGTTALMYSTKNKNHQIFDMLMAAKADVNAKSKSNATALMIACVNSNDHCVFELLDNGADFKAVDNYNKTALHYCKNDKCKLILTNYIKRTK